MTLYTRDHIVAAAREWIGTPYRHQASRKGVGTDCLGLVRGLYRELEGQEPEMPPPYTADWAEVSGETAGPALTLPVETLKDAASRHLIAIGVDEALPGDVLLFRMNARGPAKHAGILSAETRMIHACTGRAVADVHLGAWWRRKLVYAFSFPGVQR
ncbi:MAG: NlpC/P60 family protein [Parvibaculaceae bacterium]